MGKSRKKDAFVFIVLFVITVLTMLYSVYLWYASYEDGEEKILHYNEDMKLNYKVFLKENDFYEDDYLGEDYNVIASSIDKVEIDFNYLLNTSNYVRGQSYYTINSKIVAYQKIDDKKVWNNEKVIKDKIITLYENDTLDVNSKDSFSIDYQEYKKLMSDYQKNYGVSLIGQLIVEIEVNSNLEYADFKDEIKFNERVATVTMSLTDPIVTIKKSVPKLSDNNQVIEKMSSTINYLKLGLAIFAFVGGIIMSIYLGRILVKLFGYDSVYVRKLSKILRTYNSVIVSVEKIDVDNGQKILNVQSFDELLDAQFELRVPILHSNIIRNKEDLFAIKYDNDMMLFRMKSSLYEKKDKKEQDNYEEK